MVKLPSQFDCLQQQLLDAARKFASDAQPLSELLEALVGDVARAAAEPLELFPVCHHSPSSAFQMVQRLQRQQPKVIYLEMCEDLLGVVENLRDCRLPVALQAFASETDAFDPDLLPLSAIAPLTEASAEYQAIAYTLQNPATKLVFVDRAVDFVYQWRPQDPEQLAEKSDEEEEPTSEEAKLHGSARGVEVGSIVPTFGEFLTFLLRNSNTRHFAEWWDQYVEQAIIAADYETYRQVMFLIGSLMRRLGRQEKDVEEDRLRERYMWTRIKEHLAANRIAPEEAIYICGAAHTASDVPEFGTDSDTVWEIPDRTATKWLYGLIPSSFAAIEYQFSHPPGTVVLAESTWKKSLRAAKTKPFTLSKSGQKSKKTAAKASAKASAKTSAKTSAKAKSSTTKKGAAGASEENGASGENRANEANELIAFLMRSPDLVAADEEQLLSWCTEIVALSRQNGYLASTADSIAIYQTSILLANMRNRRHPTPYDFQDAAITCLEKDRTPKKRNVRQLCQILLGGDRLGTVGYESLPPLAQDVYDRLAPLELNLLAKNNQRALMDFKQKPDWLPCSDLLWRLNYLLGNSIVQPIMGERTLGHKPLQESWEVRIGKQQRQLIMLGYEAVTVEQVLEQRLKKQGLGSQAKANSALAAAEESILYLHSPRLTEELGIHSITLLTRETGAEDAPEIFQRVRRLVHYYRSTPTGLPDWIKQFVAVGYGHYATLLPQAFGDRGTSPEQIAGMLGFIFTLESLALSLGCNRSQLLIGLQQAAQGLDDAAKLGLLWTAEWLLQQRTLPEMRQFFADVLENPLLTEAFPDYLNGFILALSFAPRIAKFIVELLSKLFASVPDRLLLPWLPNLILRLRPHGQILQVLIKEAAASFPNSLAKLDSWQAPWEAAAAPTAKAPAGTGAKEIAAKQIAGKALREEEMPVRALLFQQRATTEAIARLLGVETLTWQEINDSPASPDSQLSESEAKVRSLLQANPATMEALSIKF